MIIKAAELQFIAVMDLGYVTFGRMPEVAMCGR